MYDSDWHLAGYVGVDSGQIGIADPCYVWDYEKDVLPVALKAIEDRTPFYDINDGMVLIAPTLYGDGMYPVYVKYQGGRVSAMMIDFDPPDDDYDYEEDNEEDWDN